MRSCSAQTRQSLTFTLSTRITRDSILLDQLRAVWTLMTSYEHFHNAVSPFIDNYKEAYGSDHPYLDPQGAINMAYSQNNPAKRFDEAFKEWIEEAVLSPRYNTSEGSSALLIHPTWPASRAIGTTIRPKAPQRLVRHMYGISIVSVSWLVCPRWCCRWARSIIHAAHRRRSICLLLSALMLWLGVI